MPRRHQGLKLASECRDLLGALDHMSNDELRGFKNSELSQQQQYQDRKTAQKASQETSSRWPSSEKRAQELHALCSELEATAVEHKSQLARLEAEAAEQPRCMPSCRSTSPSSSRN